MIKYIKDFILKENIELGSMYSLLKLSPADGIMPDMIPGQFVQVDIKGSKNTFLRRPISINFVDKEMNLLWLLVRRAGEGTSTLISAPAGEAINLILPLGNGFTLDNGKMLLIGGGVGVAPLLYLGKILSEKDSNVSFLLGARSKQDLLELEEFKKYGEVFVSTEDGSMGEKGFVTNHSVLRHEKFDVIQTCGPKPMMKAVARYAKANGINCEASFENMMACGLGACLCCVEKTVEGNLRVCQDGPVFNIDKLLW